MLFGDNVYHGSTAADKIYLGNTEVWSAIPADVKAHIARVIADGGTVPEQSKMVAMVKKLMTADLWNNCVFFGLPLGGVKKDGNQFVSKLYDMKANADVVQATGTAQPKYQSDGSLLYDGGDYIKSANLLTTNPISQCIDNLTVMCWVNITTVGYQFIFDRYNAGLTNNDVWNIVQRAGGQMGVFIIKNTVGVKSYDTTATISSGWKHLAFTYSVAGNSLKLYINAVEQAVTKTTNNTAVQLAATVSPVAIGSRTITTTTNPFLNGNKTALHQIYNATLTDAQILWNYNNIRPEGV